MQNVYSNAITKANGLGNALHDELTKEWLSIKHDNQEVSQL